MALDKLVLLGEATAVTPTTDTGWETYLAGSGRLFLPAATNYCTNPSFEANTGSLATGWSRWGTSQPVCSKVAGICGTGSWAQRALYDGAAPSGPEFLIYQTAAVPSTPGDVWTASFTIKGSATGCTVALQVTDQAWAHAARQVIVPTATATRYSVPYTAAAGTTGLLPMLDITAIHTGDVFDLTIDDVLIEKSAVLTPYFDGTYPDCAWTGAANGSTSTRAASRLVVPAPTGLFVNYGTIAMRTVPQWAGDNGVLLALTGVSTAAGAVTYSISKSVTNYWCSGFWDGTHWVPRYSNAALSFAAGTAHSLVSRYSDGEAMDLRYDGTTATDNALAYSFGAQAAVIEIGGSYGGNNEGCAYIGPFAICNQRITDAETVLLDAGLTAGWDGIEVFRFFQHRGYLGTLILPLEADGIGYLVDALDPAQSYVAPRLDDSLWQITAGSDAQGWRDVTDECGDLVYSNVRPGGAASCSFTIPGDIADLGYNELQPDMRLKVCYADEVCWDGFILPRGVNYQGE